MNVEIVDRNHLMELAKNPFSAGTAVISITDSDAEDVELVHLPEFILRLKFDDVSDEIYEEILGRKPNVREMHKISQRLHMFNDAQSQSIASFVLDVRSKADTLICQCEYGQSRSAAVAAAVMEYYCRKGVNVFADPRYYPNKLVYRKLLRSLRMQGNNRCPFLSPSYNI